MIWFRRLHKWIGLAIGLQVALWMLSGFMMGLLDHDRVRGHHNQATAIREPLGPSPKQLMQPSELLVLLSPEEHVTTIKLESFLDNRVYRVTGLDGARLYDAGSGRQIIITEDIAAHLARRDYSGPGVIDGISIVQAPSMEVRRHTGDVWRVDFDDDDDTSLYVSVGDGTILERRNATWRLFDLFWMLHIMDYVGREDFNNALVILASLIAAWFSVTGIVLFFESFRREDFLGLLPSSWWRTPARIAVCAPHGEVVARIDSYTDGRLYDELAKRNIVLPSNCGGGGTCGLCVVNLDPAWPESTADRRVLPGHQRTAGARLSCQAKVVDNMVVGISDDVLAAEQTTAVVTACRLVTPFIREIRLRIEGKPFVYPAGSYVHVVIPPHKIAYDSLELSPEVVAAVGEGDLPPQSVSKNEIRRAYSLATACEDSPGTIVLDVRFLPAPAGSGRTAAGVGSTYMWSLRAGDSIDIVGPLGDFRAQESDRQMVFIGGGAGMAPLRAIIREELLYKESGRRIDFWYGARGKADLLYKEEFDSLQDKHRNFRWQPVLSEPGEDDRWQGPTGFVHLVARLSLLENHRDPSSCEFYVCGPPPMLSATRRMLADLKVPETQVFFDDFGI